jgi:hypothetical protein
MILRLKRYSYGEYETEGTLEIGNKLSCATIEQPWTPNPNGAKGGKPFESCVPDGMYRLVPWESPSKGDVYMMFSTELGVYRFPQDHEEHFGRDLCLIHIANWASQVQGCVAIGKRRGPMHDDRTGKVEQAVVSSGAAMRRLRELLGRDRQHQHILSITNETGASDVTGG